MTAPSAVPMVIDTDGGVDDAVALWWACTDPRVDLVAVTCVWGNVDVDVAAANVLKVLHAAGRPDVPVAVGRPGPVAPAPELRRADFIHGTDGLGDCGVPPAPGQPVDEPAADLLARLAAERPGELTLVAVGPFSNLFDAVQRDRAWAGRWRRLVVMGGSAAIGGNAAPLGEANVVHDPVAADVTVRAAWAQPPLMVGLDVTHRATFGPAELAVLARRLTPAAAFCDGPLRFYAEHGATFCADGEVPCHDLLAVMAAAVDGLVDGPVVPVAVAAEPGPAWGTTVVDLRHLAFRRRGIEPRQGTPEGFADWQVALDADVAGFRAEVRALFGEAAAGRAG